MDRKLAKAIDAVLGQEPAAKSAEDLLGNRQHSLLSTPVLKDGYQVIGKKDLPCYQCRWSRHESNDCHFKESKWHGCVKMGHISTVCRSKRSDKSWKANPATVP